MKKRLGKKPWGRHWAWIGAAVLGLILWSGPAAWAHKINLYAEAVGSRIEGRVYFRGGAPAQDAKVEAFAPDGKKLLETKTDSAGRFTFQAPARCDYRLVVDTGDGHGAEFTLPATDLPESVPPLDKVQSSPGLPNPPPTQPKKHTDSPSVAPKPEGPALLKEGPADPAAKADASPPPDTAPDQLQQWIEEAVHRQIAPLKRQLEAMQEQTRWSDVLGGIGYIVGLTGMGFYLLGMRKRPVRPGSQNPASSTESS